MPKRSPRRLCFRDVGLCLFLDKQSLEVFWRKDMKGAGTLRPPYQPASRFHALAFLSEQQGIFLWFFQARILSGHRWPLLFSVVFFPPSFACGEVLLWIICLCYLIVFFKNILLVLDFSAFYVFSCFLCLRSLPRHSIHSLLLSPSTLTLAFHIPHALRPSLPPLASAWDCVVYFRMPLPFGNALALTPARSSSHSRHSYAAATYPS